MKKSQAYKSLVKQINASGSDKLNGYSTDLLDNIYEDEREEVENLIWSAFFDRKDIDIAVLFPGLKTRDGIHALKNVVNNYSVPSEASMLIAFIIYNNTRENAYLKLMERNIVESNYNYSYISLLICAPLREEVYEVLAGIYKKCSERVACGSVINGILYQKGYIKDINNIKEVLGMKELRKVLKNVTREQRDDMLKKFETGEFESYKI